MNCATFRRGLHDFQADELAEEERLRFQEHLDHCTECGRRLEVEEGFLRALRSRLPRQPAPPDLEIRIRARLAQLGRAAPTAWYRRPWAAALAASLLLAFLIFPRTGGRQSIIAVLVTGTEVVVVDHECDRAGRSLAQQRKCRLLSHANVLKVADGTYWRLNHDDPAVRSRLRDPEMRGHKLVVQGHVYPEIHTLRMERFEDLGLQNLQSI